MARALTTRAIEATKPDPAKRLEIPDPALTGLYLVVQPSGVKSWALRYRRGGKTVKLTLGRWPAMGLADARAAASEAIERLAQGGDPVADRRAARAKVVDSDRDTVASVIALFMKRHASRNRRADDVAAMFRREILDKWGERKIQDIQRRDVVEVLDAIVDRGSPVTANRLRAHLRTLFNWAKGRDIVQSNPVDGVPQPAAEHARDRYLREGEIPAFWAACEGIGYPFGPLYQFLLLTGQRLREAAEMTWAEIEGDLWTLPASRSKNAEGHTVPLALPVLDILDNLPRVNERFAFTTTGTSPVSGFARAKRRLDTLMPEGTEHFTIHDLRRTCASGMASLGVAPHVVEVVLNHRSGFRAGVAGVYNRFRYEDEKRAALDAWARHVMRLANGGADNVVPISPFTAM